MELYLETLVWNLSTRFFSVGTIPFVDAQARGLLRLILLLGGVGSKAIAAAFSVDCDFQFFGQDEPVLLRWQLTHLGLSGLDLCHPLA